MRGSVRTRMDVTILAKAGRYELLEELGRGAMGVVYRAQDPVIGRPVAVKTLRLSEEGTGITRPELIARFQTEARAAGLLTHPNIVTIYDAGEEEGLFYITMELVEGRSLQALLDAGQSFPTPRTLRLMEQVCSALEFAHQRNIVHRDIKPANLMLTEDDTVKITDFGTAKILQFGTAQTAHVIGTPSYMSPEQIKGKPVDGRSDIFSLGVILYELVTGEKPFPGQNITTVIYKIVNEEPIPPRELDSSVHPGLSYVITRALAKLPEERYQSCRELLDALRNYRDLGASPAVTQALPARGTAAAAAGSARVSPAAPQASVAPREPVSDVLTEPESPKNNLWLALVLLAIIAVAGHKIWPYLRDVWEHGRSAEAPAQQQPLGPLGAGSNPPQPVSSGPATQNDIPADGTLSPENAADETAKETKRDAAQSETKPILETPSGKAPQTQSTRTSPGRAEQAAKSGHERAQPALKNSVAVSRAAEEQAPPKSPAPVSRPAADAQLRARIQQRLTEAGLAGKVQVQVSGNSVTLSGRLHSREYRLLLWHLRDVPSWIRVVDHIEYASASPGDVPGRGEEPPRRVAADVLGRVFVLTTPADAEILVDDVAIGRRTPARLELPPGEHSLTFSLKGFTIARRTIQVEQNQTMQISVTLH